RLLAVSPRTSVRRTVTRRGGTTASAPNPTALSISVTSSLGRVSPAANSRSSVISTQSVPPPPPPPRPPPPPPHGPSRAGPPPPPRAPPRGPPPPPTGTPPAAPP